MSEKEKIKPEPEVNEDGYRIITEKYACALCEYHGGYLYPHLNKNCYLHYTGFHKIENLDNFINLRVLYLEGNRIQKIENLDKLTSLTCLYLQNNYINKIENLEHNKNLVILNLTGNQIKKIENLEALTELKNLYLEKNDLSTPEDIQDAIKCKALTLLDIQSNQFDQNGEGIINVLSQIVDLRVLYFKGNDVLRTISNYRRTMIAKIQHLTYLDDRPVREEERVGAKAFMEGGHEAEVKARQEFKIRKEGLDPEKLKEKERNKGTYEERRRKALEHLKREYDKRKNELEEKKKELMKEYEEHPEKRDNLNIQLSAVDYQLEENEKYKCEESENKSIGLFHNSNAEHEEGKFEYKEWMDEIVINEVTDNLFDFSRALRLIYLELKKSNVANYKQFTLLDLRNKWTELELKQFRIENDEDVYHYSKQDLFPEDNKQQSEQEVLSKQTETQSTSANNNNDNESAFIKITEATIEDTESKEEMIDTSSSPGVQKLNLDELD